MTRIPHDSKLGACLRRTGHSAGGCGLSAEVGGHIQIGWVSVELAGSSNFWHEACHRSSEFKKEMEKLFSCRVVAHVLTISIFGDNHCSPAPASLSSRRLCAHAILWEYPPILFSNALWFFYLGAVLQAKIVHGLAIFCPIYYVFMIR